MANLTSLIRLEKVPYSNFAKIGEDKCYDIDVTQISGSTAVGTHNIIDIPVGSALLEAKLVVKESADSAGDGAAVQFKIGSETLSAAIPQADLVAGKVIKLDGNQYTGETDGTSELLSADVDAGVSGYCPSVADTLDMVVSGEALTALRFALVVTFWDMDKALGNA